MTALDQATDLLSERLRELDQERRQIEKALSQLKDQRPRRRARNGSRSDQVMKAISDNPGIRPSEVAKQIGIAPNYVYRLIGDLKKEKKIRKSGQGYAVKEGS